MLNSHSQKTQLNYEGTYACPICRCGQISSLTLMEALGCNVCHHIFTINLEKQSLKMADREPALMWSWTGKTWKGEHLGNLELSWIYWMIALSFVLFPPSLIGLSALIFPPISGSAWSWFPLLWTILSFVVHLLILLWLMAEAYQFPVLLFMKTQWQRLLNPRRGNS
jgi:hypothetical protein